MLNGGDLEFHPLADLFPLIEGQEFQGLVDNIRENGLLEPGDLYEGKILEGRNRYRACRAAGVECRFKQYTGNDPLGYVISKNIMRRHVMTEQRAMLAASLEQGTWGGPRGQDARLRVGPITRANAPPECAMSAFAVWPMLA